jgi:hypothetical protein
MADFPILLREGAFHGSPLVVTAGTDTWVVSDLLAPFEGKRVRVAAHHLPSALDPARWGGGSCGWAASGWCPAGHHLRPTWLYNVTAEGVLVRDVADQWVVEVPSGQRVVLDLATNLMGHTGRVAAALVSTVEEMRDALGGVAGVVEGLGVRATDLRELLARLKSDRGA